MSFFHVAEKILKNGKQEISGLVRRFKQSF
jgi:hypothetical protein